MARIVLDFTNMPGPEERVSEPLPEGVYNVRIDKKEDARYRATPKGNELLDITFTVIDGEYAGRKFRDSFFIVPEEWRERLYYFLQEIGMINGPEKLVLDTDAFQGKELTVEVIQTRDGQGVVRNRIRRVIAVRA